MRWRERERKPRLDGMIWNDMEWVVGWGGVESTLSCVMGMTDGTELCVCDGDILSKGKRERDGIMGWNGIY